MTPPAGDDPYPNMIGVRVRRGHSAKRESDPEPRRLPPSRDDCRDGIRPCPYVTCRHNLFLDVTKGGGIRFPRPDLEPGELSESCVLDVVGREGPLTLEAIGDLLGLTRERVRQIEEDALRHFGEAASDTGLTAADLWR